MFQCYNKDTMVARRGYKKDPRKKNSQLRAALRRQILNEQDTCAICGRPVDVHLPAGSPLSPEIDHIIPISRGGSAYDIDNLCLVHKICNQRKGNRMDGDGIPKNQNPLPISHNW